MANITNAPTSPASANPSREGASPLVLIFRTLRWTIYGFALVALILLLHKATPPPVAATPEAAARAEQKVQAVQQAAAQGQPATLRMDETELNSYLASHLNLPANQAVANGASTGSGDPTVESSNDDRLASDDVEQMRSNVQDVKVQLIGDRVRAYVVFNVHGKDMTLQLEGKLGADNGFLNFEPVSGQIGALPIPQSFLEAAVRKKMDSPENREKLRLPSDISDLHVENGEVVAQFQ